MYNHGYIKDGKKSISSTYKTIHSLRFLKQLEAMVLLFKFLFLQKFKTIGSIKVFFLIF